MHRIGGVGQRTMPGVVEKLPACAEGDHLRKPGVDRVFLRSGAEHSSRAFKKLVISVDQGADRLASPCKC